MEGQPFKFYFNLNAAGYENRQFDITVNQN